MNIGKVIRTLRQERGETLEQVALEIGTDASNLSRIERGVQQPSNGLLVAIASKLETSITSIYALAEGIRKPGQLSATGLADEIDFSSEAAMLRKHFRTLSPDNQQLAVEFVKLLSRQQRKG